MQTKKHSTANKQTNSKTKNRQVNLSEKKLIRDDEFEV